MGVNPVDYETYSKFKAAKLGVGKTDSTESATKVPATLPQSNASGSPDNPTNNGGDTSNIATLVATESKLSDKVQARLAFAVEELYALAEADEEAALKTIADFEGALRSKMRNNPRMVAMS